MIYAVTGENEALGSVPEVPDWGLVSIRDVGEIHDAPVPWRHTHIGPVLNLRFDDVSRWTESLHLRGYRPPLQEHARAIVTFAQEGLGVQTRAMWESQVPGVFVHCAAGISRSSAALCGIVAATEGPGKAVERLIGAVRLSLARGWRDSGGVRPNLRLIALLDRELDLGWRLLRDVRSAFIYPDSETVQTAIEDSARPE